MEDDLNTLPVGTRLGEFEILGVVGAGGFGIVYRALDHDLEREVAIKEYMPGLLASRTQQGAVRSRGGTHAETFRLGLSSFVLEAKTLARFDHPALIKVYRYWEGNGTAYMVMPLVSGRTLGQVVRQMPKPPSEDWLNGVLTPLLAALDVLHQHQICHRDIAPDNVILLPSGQPMLLDFGAARQVIADRTQALTAVLKPSYAPIEQYAEVTTLRQGPWTDLYALGAVVYGCLAGRPPPAATARAVADDMLPLSEVAARIEAEHGQHYSPGFAAAWQATLALRPADRPQDVAALRRLLGRPSGAVLDLSDPVRTLVLAPAHAHTVTLAAALPVGDLPTVFEARDNGPQPTLQLHAGPRSGHDMAAVVPAPANAATEPVTEVMHATPPALPPITTPQASPPIAAPEALESNATPAATPPVAAAATAATPGAALARADPARGGGGGKLAWAGIGLGLALAVGAAGFWLRPAATPTAPPAPSAGAASAVVGAPDGAAPTAPPVRAEGVSSASARSAEPVPSATAGQAGARVPPAGATSAAAASALSALAASSARLLQPPGQVAPPAPRPAGRKSSDAVATADGRKPAKDIYLPAAVIQAPASKASPPAAANDAVKSKLAGAAHEQDADPAAHPSAPISPEESCGRRWLAARDICYERACRGTEAAAHPLCVQWREKADRAKREKDYVGG